MNLGLEGKTALVSGGSRGIGLAIARALHAEGCTVALAARGAEGLAQSVAAVGPRASSHVADLTSAAAAQSLVADLVRKWQRLDIMICNVGSGASVPPGQESAEEWRRVFDLNLGSTTNLLEAAAPAMTAPGGAIVCISSICGIAALGAPVTYSAAKAALNATVRGLARPLGARGIRINSVAPGNIVFEGGTWARKLAADAPAVNDMLRREVALARLGTPEEIADLVTFLASPRASFITGATYVADGGQLRS